ncbi:translocase [Pseudooceanicola nanhaiensis]|uniref:preprotein translocase subunit SecA n=1 Tax=Pseudooceanicola nanhaiensis TaxID=375761 RepID=UPI001CD3E43A|nr:translocase [Pseudooceanicola nanhaiensis]MCA0919582.1 translocase [Pseudooceanicola nanhaiensis]
MPRPSAASTLASPPAVRFYPERADRDDGWLEEAGQAVVGSVARGASRATAPLRDRVTVRRIRRAGQRLAGLDEAAFDAELGRLRMQLRRCGLTDATLRLGLACAREATFRTLGLRHHDVQIRGALAMLRGRLIEMDTGEGKTITAGLAAATAALCGVPTHVITVNNYLAERDAEGLAPLYARMGLRVGVIREKMPPAERRAAYHADITYASNTEIAFDYLRDRIAFGPEGPQGLRQRLRRLSGGDTRQEPVMRGLAFAIVDEADSVLVDEARTPLIISRQTDPEAEAIWANRALALARLLTSGSDYKLNPEERRVHLTERGKARLEELTEGEGGIWASRIKREEVVYQALSALFLFHSGDHYLVREGKVQIVDEYTGRLQPDRSWSDGMHQLVEAKEGVEVTAQNLPVARMTYQRFFRRYEKLAGMTGTAREVRGELRSVFGLVVQRIPPNRRSRLRIHPPRVYRTAERKWSAVVAEARRAIAAGRPVLIGTRSVATSETVSEWLSRAGMDHVVLNAENDGEEAQIIARAGEPGRITVATNMAGRGVDIALAPGVSEKGGLHVILTERHDSARIDRQFAGRTGRRGEPGTAATLLSLEDPLAAVLRAPLLKGWARVPLFGLAARPRVFDRAQRRAEKSHARARKDLVRQDRRLDRMLSFTGGLE